MPEHPFKNVVSFFPEDGGKSPREGQLTAFKESEKAFDTGKKFLIIRAPTGTGKSYIGMTLAGAVADVNDKYKSLVLSREIFARDVNTGQYPYASQILAMPRFGASIMTVSKVLQDQYVDDFSSRIMSFKGKSNYRCAVDANFDCSFAPCTFDNNIKKTCQSQHACPYYFEQENSAISKNNALNYSVFFNLPEHVAARQLLVFDEASELEKELVSAFSVELDTKYLRETCGVIVRTPSDSKRMGGWVNDTTGSLSEAMREAMDKFTKSNKKDRSQMVKYKYMDQLSSKLSRIQEDLASTEFVISEENDGRIIKIQPVYVAHIFRRVTKHSSHVVLMSATIIDVVEYAKTLGLKEDEYTFVDIPSTFDPIKSPVRISKKIFLSQKNMTEKLPEVVSFIEKILEAHKNDKGLIHSHTMKITDYLQENLGDRRCLFRTADKKNEEILLEHIQTRKPTVLVSPSMTHGVDLKGDLAKFQIIIKAPFAPLGDPRIARLAKENSRWYKDQMLSTVIQACGRGSRNETDECVTYIIDGVLSLALEENQDILPPDFVARMQAKPKPRAK